MTYREAMAVLEKAGTAQNRKVYARHGVVGPMFGVGYANLGKLKEQIRVDHELARRLWASGNHDARVLATMIADPGALTSAEADADAWAGDLNNYVLTDAFSGLVVGSVHARKKLKSGNNRMVSGRGGWGGGS